MAARPSGLGQSLRGDMSLRQAVRQFSDVRKIEAWFIARRWPQGMCCPYCEGRNLSPRPIRRRTPVYRCNPCKRDFTVKTGTLMHDSKLPLSKWALAFCLVSINRQRVSSMQLHRDLGITQTTAWHLGHRIREAWEDATAQGRDPVAADETGVGGKEKHKHSARQRHAGPRAVAGGKDRLTHRVEATPEALADAVLQAGPKRDWRYMRAGRKAQR